MRFPWARRPDPPPRGKILELMEGFAELETRLDIVEDKVKRTNARLSALQSAIAREDSGDPGQDPEASANRDTTAPQFIPLRGHGPLRNLRGF